MSVDIVLTVDFRPDDENGGYWATCRELPAVAGYGKTRSAARADARREIRLALQDLAEDGDPTPPLEYSPPWRRRQLPHAA